MKQGNKRNLKPPVLAAALATLLGTAPLAAQACGPDSYMGTICTVAFNYCPENTLPANGQLLSVNQFTALFALLGTTYGGDGRSTFGLPDLRGRTAVGVGTGIGLNPVQLGQADGAENATLTPNNMPPAIPASFSNVKASGTVDLPLAGATVTGQNITGSVTVKALNGDAQPVGPINTPTTTANTLGKSTPANIFYPPGNNQIAVPTTHNLGVTGGTIAGKATGPVELPVSGNIAIGGGGVPVKTISPRLGLTACIVVNGSWPPRP